MSAGRQGTASLNRPDPSARAVGWAAARRGPFHRWEHRMKIKVKKVEPIEATRIHLDPDPPQGAA
jgi:hypothetical protein